MSRIQAVVTLVGFLFLVFAIGVVAGYTISSSRYRGDIAAYKDIIAENQTAIRVLESDNRELGERQRETLGVVRSARGILARSAGDIAAAGSAVDDIEELADGILRAVDSLTAAYRVLGSVESRMEDSGGSFGDGNDGAGGE